jgi:hypothetical protein
MLTNVDFDWTHMSVTQESLDPLVRTDDVDDVMLTSVGTHLSARNHYDNVMLTSASHVDQPQHDMCQPRIIQPLSNFRNDLNFGNS